MGGGYAIPEFGLAYVRNMRFFDQQAKREPRLVDMLVSACYCMSGAELYPNPRNHEEVKLKKNVFKLTIFLFFNNCEVKHKKFIVHILNKEGS
jgi:hypothetical protein